MRLLWIALCSLAAVTAPELPASQGALQAHVDSASSLEAENSGKEAPKALPLHMIHPWTAARPLPASMRPLFPYPPARPEDASSNIAGNFLLMILMGPLNIKIPLPLLP